MKSAKNLEFSIIYRDSIEPIVFRGDIMAANTNTHVTSPSDDNITRPKQFAYNRDLVNNEINSFKVESYFLH